MNKYSLHQLKNGLRMAMIPNKNTQAVTVLVLVKVGSRQEPAEVNGISHFIEHMMFKGTQKRPKPTDISVELESVGADFNAFTSKEYTGYYIKLAADKLELALDMLSDILTSSTFAAAEVERERGVILEEINMYEDNPRANIDNLYEESVYGGHSLGRPVIGPKAVISRLKRSQLLAYKNEFYYGANAVLAVAGKYDDHNTRKLIDKYFSKFNSRHQGQDIASFKSNQNRSRVKIKYKKTEQTHLMLGLPAWPDDDPRTPALKLLSVILGGGMSSRLFVNIREKRGLCYSIIASLSTYEDTGDFMVKAGLDTSRLLAAVKLILAELKKTKTSNVSKLELQKAKDFVRGSAALSLEDSEAQAAWYGREIIYGEKIQTPDQRLAQLEKVTIGDLRRVASEIFLTPRLNLALIGPIKPSSKASLEQLLRI